MEDLKKYIKNKLKSIRKPPSYAREFSNTESYIKSVGDFSKKKVVDALMGKIKHDVISNAQDFRILSKIFKTYPLPKEPIANFLEDGGMTIKTLQQNVNSKSKYKSRVNDLKGLSKEINYLKTRLAKIENSLKKPIL